MSFYLLSSQYWTINLHLLEYVILTMQLQFCKIIFVSIEFRVGFFYKLHFYGHSWNLKVFYVHVDKLYLSRLIFVFVSA